MLTKLVGAGDTGKKERILNQCTRKRVTISGAGVFYVDRTEGGCVVMKDPKPGSKLPRVACYARPNDRKPAFMVRFDAVVGAAI